MKLFIQGDWNDSITTTDIPNPVQKEPEKKEHTCYYCDSNEVIVKRKDGAYLCQTCYNAWRDGQGYPEEDFVDLGELDEDEETC